MLGKLSTILLTVAVAFGLMPLIGPVAAKEGHNHAGPSQAGNQSQVKHYHFEATFSKAGIKLTAHGRDHKAIDVSGLSATATFYHPSSEKPWFTRKLRPGAVIQGQAPTSLELAIDLSKVPAKGTRVSFQVSGLPDPTEPTATFTVPFTLADQQAITVGQATRADEKANATLKVCPVSGEELGGDMGPPIKVSRGGSSIFLCCKNCLKQVQADPDKFFSR